MTPQEFAYWLQGYFELNDSATIDDRQAQIIKDHLALVFKKATPTRVQNIDLNDVMHQDWNTPACSISDEKYC